MALALTVLLPAFLAGFPAVVAASDDLRIVRVYYPDLATRNRIVISFESALLETRYAEGYHVLEASQEDVDRLEAVGLVVQDDPFYQPHSQRVPGFTCYETVEETFAAAQAIVASYPDLAEWNDIGNSWEKDAALGGYDIMALVLTNASTAGDKPKLLLTCAIHAREYATAALCLDFAEYLVTGHGVEAETTWLLDHHEIHLVLQANPDGRKLAETGLYWRKNTNQNYCGATSSARGADLNRNFPFQWSCCGGSSNNPCANDYRGPAPTSEPEVSALVSYAQQIFTDQRGPDMEDVAPDDATGVSIDVHSYGDLVLWPWGHTGTLAPNGIALQTLGRKLAYENGYWPDQAIGLYPTDGTTDDFFYGDLGVAAFTIELGTQFFEACNFYENTIRPDNIPTLVYATKATRAPYVTPSGPDVSAISLAEDSVIRGQSVTLSADLDDTRYSGLNGAEASQNIAEAEYYIDSPPWEAGVAIAMAAADGSFDSPVEAVNGTVETAVLSVGQHMLFVRGRDADGNWGAFSADFLTVEPSAVAPGLSAVARIVLGFVVLVSGLGWFAARPSSSGARPGRSRSGRD
ncbi:MAG: M14 family zinc carboxypeptidase [Myxococcota bacterium]